MLAGARSSASRSASHLLLRTVLLIFMNPHLLTTKQSKRTWPGESHANHFAAIDQRGADAGRPVRSSLAAQEHKQPAQVAAGREASSGVSARQLGAGHRNALS